MRTINSKNLKKRLVSFKDIYILNLFRFCNTMILHYLLSLFSHFFFNNFSAINQNQKKYSKSLFPKWKERKKNYRRIQYLSTQCCDVFNQEKKWIFLRICNLLIKLWITKERNEAKYNAFRENETEYQSWYFFWK